MSVVIVLVLVGVVWYVFRRVRKANQLELVHSFGAARSVSVNRAAGRRLRGGF